MKEKFLYVFILILSLLLVFNHCDKINLEKDLSEQIRVNNIEIVKNSKLIKEKDGQYSKFVNNFNEQKDLLNQLKEENKNLYKTLKNNDEKLLMINNSLITLKSKIIEGFGKFNPNDSNLIDLALKYPEEKDWFVSWNGSVHKKTAHYKGDWVFGSLPLQIILTETEKGIWNSRLIGPEWLKVQKMEVNALKPEDIKPPYVPEPRNTGFLIGGGYVKGMNTITQNAISFGVGVYHKSNSLTVNFNSNNTLSFNYYYRFITFKKK